VIIINNDLIMETIESIIPLINTYERLSLQEKDDLRVLSLRLGNYLGYVLWDIKVENDGRLIEKEV